MTNADRILNFLKNLHLEGTLPEGIHILEPFTSPDVWSICTAFYHKYYDDKMPRKLMLGINPGRLGAGSTGVPFTDTKRLNEACDIEFTKFVTHEPSSVFMYEMMEAYGGVDRFYSHFYINSVFPLGFIKKDGARVVNFNYYDSKALLKAVQDDIEKNIRIQHEISGGLPFCYCIGSGKNYTFLSQFNEQMHLFDEIIPLEHPRFIMQYKSREKSRYIDDYIMKLSKYTIEH